MDQRGSITGQQSEIWAEKFMRRNQESLSSIGEIATK